MLTLNPSAPSPYRTVGLVLLSVHLSMYVCGFPPFQLGIWVQSEPAEMFLFTFGAFNALWLSLGLVQGWLLREKTSALWICLLLWLFWQLIATLHASSSWRSWFGPPETGEGLGWHVAQVVLAVMIYALWRDKKARHWLVAWAGLNILVQAGLHIAFPQDPDGLFNPESWAPAQWGAYMAFMVVALWIASVDGAYAKQALLTCLLIVLVYVVLYVSQNKSATFLIGGGMMVSTLVAGMKFPKFLRRLLYPGRFWRLVFIITCLLPLAALAASSLLSNWHVSSDNDGIAQVLTNREEGMGSRLGINEVGVSTLRHEPRRWLAGDGWGRFTDDMFKYVLIDGVTAYHNGHQQPNWFLVNGNAFHSHNMPLEALLSLGLPGMALWFAFPLLGIWLLPRRYFWRVAPMLAAVTLLSYLWFELPQCVPYNALAIAALCALCARPSGAPPAGRGLPSLLLVICAVALAVSGWEVSKAMLYGEQARIATRNYDGRNYSAEWLESDTRRGADRFRMTLIHYLPYVAGLSADGNATASDHVWYEHFMQAAHDVSYTPHMGARASYGEVQTLFAALLYLGDDHRFDDIRHGATGKLEAAVLHLCEIAPLRDDLTAPFLYNIDEFTKGDKAKQEAIARKILAIVPEHRGALWKLGQLLRARGDEAEGKALMKKAISLGAAKVYPVTKEELAEWK